mmetsp:Transcript_13594/g.36203  ORF Transcript_13594/g.36203 Transcript_13594/m.36203 type:complete len:223 (+) Transcript_13594:372-1040(+)
MSLRRDLREARNNCGGYVVAFLDILRRVCGDALGGPSLADHRSVRHREAEPIRRLDEVQRLLPALHKHERAVVAHLLAGVAGELHHLALRLLRHRRYVLANLGLLQEGVRNVGDFFIDAQAIDANVELAVELVEFKHGRPRRQILWRENGRVELHALLLAVRRRKQRERAETIPIRPRRRVRDLRLDRVHRGALSSTAQATKNHDATALLWELGQDLVGHLA